MWFIKALQICGFASSYTTVIKHGNWTSYVNMGLLGKSFVHRGFSIGMFDYTRECIWIHMYIYNTQYKIKYVYIYIYMYNTQYNMYMYIYIWYTCICMNRDMGLLRRPYVVNGMWSSLAGFSEIFHCSAGLTITTVDGRNPAPVDRW